MGMLAVKTIGIVPTVVFFSNALSPPFLPSCCVLAQVHLSERPHDSVLNTHISWRHCLSSMCRVAAVTK